MFYWDPTPEIFFIPFVNLPVRWYGVLFAAGFILGLSLWKSILTRYFSVCTDLNLEASRQRAVLIADRGMVYMVMATLVGARLGHILFYERFETYLSDPLAIFRVWEGGLASHGAVLSIILAMMLFAHRIRSIASFNVVRLLDLMSPSVALAAFFIRIGNFMNQEILGTPTTLPWGVLFGHPIDRSDPVLRHPVQIYEALFYLLVFFLLWRLSYKPYFLKTSGKMIGLFLILVFGFRFLIEYVKLEQSPLISFYLTMGQVLSIPVIFLGIFFYLFPFSRQKNSACANQ